MKVILYTTALFMTCLLTCYKESNAFTVNGFKTCTLRSDATVLHASRQDRRSFISKLPATAVSHFACMAAMDFGPKLASATIMDSGNVSAAQNIFKPGEKMSSDVAKKRFVGAMTEVDFLIENYADITSKEGGDGVRRYLGTVGVEKNMYGITKVVKVLREEADDIVEYTELANDFEAYLYQAEGAAYQSLFVEHSSAKGTPETFLATAKKDVLNMRKYMGELAQLLNLA
mmetsp:Transcript_13740/g.19654  ORF Transcript_13740/g.19654 Transcript_13740/m.19654 type:complete len:230 (-) Transcript_13740:42-731(-)